MKNKAFNYLLLQFLIAGVLAVIAFYSAKL